MFFCKIEPDDGPLSLVRSKRVPADSDEEHNKSYAKETPKQEMPAPAPHRKPSTTTQKKQAARQNPKNISQQNARASAVYASMERCASRRENLISGCCNLRLLIQPPPYDPASYYLTASMWHVLDIINLLRRPSTADDVRQDSGWQGQRSGGAHTSSAALHKP